MGYLPPPKPTRQEGRDIPSRLSAASGLPRHALGACSAILPRFDAASGRVQHSLRFDSAILCRLAAAVVPKNDCRLKEKLAILEDALPEAGLAGPLQLQNGLPNMPGQASPV